MKKQDLLTKEEFSPKRTNQKFACADNRKTYHNLKARKAREITRGVDYIIKKNWNILKHQLKGNERTTRSKQFLLGAGYNFKYYQQAFDSYEGIVQALYDCGIIVEDENIIIIAI